MNLVEEASEEDTQMHCFVVTTAFPSANGCRSVAIEMHNQVSKENDVQREAPFYGISLATLLV